VSSSSIEHCFEEKQAQNHASEQLVDAEMVRQEERNMAVIKKNFWETKLLGMKRSDMRKCQDVGNAL